MNIKEKLYSSIKLIRPIGLIKEQKERISKFKDSFRARNIIRFWAYDFAIRLFIFIFSMWTIRNLLIAINWLEVPVGIFLSMIYIGNVILSDVFVQYGKYINKQQLLEESLSFKKGNIHVVSYRELRRLLNNGSMITISNMDDNKEHFYGFMNIVDDGSKVICHEDIIGVGNTVLYNRDRIFSNSVLSININADDTSKCLISSQLYIDRNTLYVLGFFGWLKYRYMYMVNLKKAGIFSNISARLYGADIYRKLLETTITVMGYIANLIYTSASNPNPIYISTSGNVGIGTTGSLSNITNNTSNSNHTFYSSASGSIIYIPSTNTLSITAANISANTLSINSNPASNSNNVNSVPNTGI